MKSLKYTFLSLLFFCAITNANEGQLDLSEEIERYITVFTTEADFKKHEAAKELIWSGLSDTRLFDIIEQDLLSQYDSVENRDKNKIDLLLWELRALAASGQQKYIKTFNKVVTKSTSKRLQKHGPQFKAHFKQYAVWNPIIMSNEGDIGDVDKTESRYINMLNSQHLELMRAAAKRIYYSYNQNEKVLDIAAKQLRVQATKKKHSKLWLDTLAWLCKALAASDQEKYAEDLQFVAENTTSAKLSQYARRNLISMQANKH